MSTPDREEVQDTSNREMDQKRCTDEAQCDLGHKEHCKPSTGRKEDADELGHGNSTVPKLLRRFRG